MLAARAERGTGADQDVGDGAGHEDLPRFGERADPRRDVDADASDVRARPLAFGDVNPDPELEAERRDVPADRPGGGDRCRRRRELGEEAVARGVEFGRAFIAQLAADLRVVPGEDVLPCGVARARRR